jgi:hypothetical protein
MNKVKNLTKTLKNFFLNPRFLVSFFILFTFTIINATYVHADIDESTLDFYDTNGIFYYDGKASGGGCNSPLDLSNNTLYNGEPVIDQASLKRIEENKPVYEAAANEQGFEWQILAAIHGMESSFVNNKNPKGNSQGVYQFLELDGMFPAGQKISPAEFEKQTKMAAEQIRKNYSQGLDLSVENDIKRMFYNYNSGPKGSKLYNDNARKWLHYTEEQIKIGEGSPYVMNLADEQRDSRHNEHWQEFHCDHNCIDRATVRPGAFLIYKALGGRGSASGNNCTGGETGNLIADTAISFSWPEGQEAEAVKLNMVDKYEEALKIAGTGGHVYHGASCDVFVTTVMRYTKLDPDFVCCGMSASKGRATGHYVEGNPSKYQPIPEFDGTNWNVLQNGDIVMNHQHIAIFFKTKDGVTKLAHASKGEITNRTPRITGTYNNGFKAYRFIGANTSTTNNTNTTTTPLNTNNSTNSTNNTVNTPTEQ